MIKGVFHLHRDSGNSAWDVNGTHVFGTFHWKISGINGTSEKVVLFSRWKLFRWKCVFHLRVLQGFTSSRHFTTISSHRNMAAASSSSVSLFRSVTSNSTFYEWSVCHGLAPDFQTLISHDCTMYVNGKWYLSKKTLNFTLGFCECCEYFPPKILHM